MDVGTLRTEGNAFEAPRGAAEAEGSLVVDAQPKVSGAVGHHAARERMATPHLRLSRPASLHPTISPKHQLVVAGHPEAPVGIGGKGIDGTALPLGIAVVEQLELRTPCTDEIDTRSVISHPDVAIFVLHHTARIE